MKGMKMMQRKLGVILFLNRGWEIGRGGGDGGFVGLRSGIDFISCSCHDISSLVGFDFWAEAYHGLGYCLSVLFFVSLNC